MSLGTKIKMRLVAPTLLAVVLSLWMTDQVMAKNAVAGKGVQPTYEQAPVISAPAATPVPVPLAIPPSPPAPIVLAPAAAPAATPAAIPVPATTEVSVPATPKTNIAVPALLIKTGNHGTFARAVFDCPKLTAYHITATGDVLHITLDTKAAGKIVVAKTPLIKKITATPGHDGLLRVDIVTPAGVTFKDSRFQNKIILDISAATASAPAPAPAVVTPAKVAAEKKKPLPAPISITPAKVIASTPAPAAPSPKVVAAPATEKTAAVPAMPVAPVEKDSSPALSDPEAIAAARIPGKSENAAPVWDLAITKPDGGAPVEKKATPVPAPPATAAGEDDRTATITLSSLSPMRLAAFERFGALWLVTDAKGTAASLPVITGPMADFIIPPKVLRFKQGTAYRYTFPKKFYPHVAKQNLSWTVTLLPEPSPASAATLSAELRVQSDKKTKEVMLVAYLKGAGDVLSFEDPEIGDTLFVVPTNIADQAVQEARHMTDLETIPALTGLVIRPLKDGLSVRHIMLADESAVPNKKDNKDIKDAKDVQEVKDKDSKDSKDGKDKSDKEKAAAAATAPLPNNTAANDVIVATAPFGLSVMPEGDSIITLIGADEAADDYNNRLFNFPNWQRGGIEKLQSNRQELQEKIAAAASPEERAGLLMDLAKLYFANNFGQEALGILDMVQIENPDMEKNPDFIAIRGAASAMSGHYKEALQDLSFPAIQKRPEVNLWIGFASAATEQWHMADRSFPKSNRLLLQYPDNIAIPFTIYMAESALHLGHTDMANQLLDSINKTSEVLDPRYKAAIDYLRGIAFAQQGAPEKAAALWEPVAGGLDRLYHTKAALSLTRLQLQEKKITLKEAIDRVDSLRFAWRGDGLEVTILHTLGALKVQDGQVLSGMEDMKQAADMADSLLDDSVPIRDDMKHILSDLFLTDTVSKIKPLEAVSVYNEFGNLIPPGPDAVTAALNFADSLIRMDLLSKAAALLEDQLKSGNLPEDKAAALGTKLTAVYLLDSNPKQALAALQETEKPGLSDRIREERTLLKARAQSQLNETADAITTLSALNSKNAQRLKADVFWRAQKWSEAATAIETLLPDPTKPLSEQDASYVVNAAVAWKIAGNMDKLKEIKMKYEGPIATTKLATTFGVVTRDGGSSALGDRETMLKIAGEVDMFKGFLENYKAGLGSGS